MAFKGRNSVTSKIVLNNKNTKQVNFYNYFGNLMSCEREVDTAILNNCLKITGIKLSHIRFLPNPLQYSVG
jgi:hypothetical protein